MAFQMNEAEIHERLIQIAQNYDPGKGETVGQWIDRIEPDPKIRQKLMAVLLISIRCEKEKRDPWQIRKLICWRDPDGKPNQIEAQWKAAPASV